MTEPALGIAGVVLLALAIVALFLRPRRSKGRMVDAGLAAGAGLLGLAIGLVVADRVHPPAGVLAAPGAVIGQVLSSGLVGYAFEHQQSGSSFFRPAAVQAAAARLSIRICFSARRTTLPMSLRGMASMKWMWARGKPFRVSWTARMRSSPSIGRRNTAGLT